ncbi:hypothetical protein LX32DRAFT_575900, partial [Colletotrichum zoysiae]
GAARRRIKLHLSSYSQPLIALLNLQHQLRLFNQRGKYRLHIHTICHLSRKV